MSGQSWSPKKQQSVSICDTCGRSAFSERLQGAGYACAGLLVGSLIMSWRKHLSFKMNLLSWIYDRLELFPNQVSIRNEQQSKDLVKRIRTGWKLAEYLPYFEGPGVQKTVDVAVPSREKDRTILCRVYRPHARGILPVVMFVHGGGYSFGSIYVYDSLARDLAHRSKCCIVSVDYRLSPEHKFPRGLEDCEDTLSWIASMPSVFAQDMESDPSQLAICGDSAGGNFCASLAVYAKQKGISLTLQCLLYPNTSQYSIPHWRDSHLPLPNDSTVLYSRGPMLNHSAIVWGCGLYLRSPEDAYNPKASPYLYSLEDLEGVAPAYVAVAGRDMLRDEGIEYAKKLQKAGVKTKLRYYHNTIHAFVSLHFCDDGNIAMEELSATLFSAFHQKGAAL